MMRRILRTLLAFAVLSAVVFLIVFVIRDFADS